jgi:predicted ATP-dependent endonuclease of OLD family
VIKRLEVKNFRCLRDVTIELGPLTVLVGPNASGKSAVLRALMLPNWSLEDRWRHESVAV